MALKKHEPCHVRRSADRKRREIEDDLEWLKSRLGAGTDPWIQNQIAKLRAALTKWSGLRRSLH
jgi:hypothetical protein